MKVVCLLLVLLPLAATAEKRFILDNVMSLLSSADLAKYVNLIVDQAGSDATEQQCETACLDVMANDLLDTACPFICNSFQSLVHRFHIGSQPATGPAKRFILDNVMSLLSSADLAKYVNLIVDQAGSDATEQQCETACLDVMANDLLDTACPFICNSFQSLVHRFHIGSQPATGPAKRFNLDNVMSLLSTSDLAKYVNLIVDQAGSDATEQQCETACLDVMANDLLDTACPFICNSFQALVHRFHLNGQPATGPAKRFILDNVMSLLSTSDLAKYVNLIVDQAGSDATEQQCETACLDVMANDLLDTACPFICNSFQALVHRFHLNGQPATGPAKRFILDNVMSLLSSADLAKYVNLIVDQAGSDATEQQCETACLDVMANDLLDTACPFVCNSFQSLVHRFHIGSQPAKIFILDNVMSLLSSADLAKYVNLIVDQAGSDATEQQCETACLDVMANDLLDTACPFICNSFQSLVKRFHIGSQPATGPAKRFILDNVMSLLSSADLAKYVNLIVDQAGSDATEQQCETACLDVMANDLLDTACPFICNSFQSLVHRFHIGNQPATGPAKRFILDNVMSLLSRADLAKYVNLIVDQAGSDATEQQCETACLDVMANDLLDTACPFICNSFQSLVHRFHIGSQPATGPAKRFILDNVMSLLSSADLAKYVNLIVDQAGSDATEQQCETACLDVMANDLLDTACPFICNSFQSLVHQLHIGNQPASGPAKRIILDNVMSLLSSSDLAKYVNLIVDQAGSDATEQQCETACLDVMANDLLDTACPFICNSFQSLVHRFHIGSQSASGPAKRFILDNVMSLLSTSDLAKYVNLIVDQAGSDATEQQCETACLDVMANDLLDTACPFICNSFQALVHRFHLNGQPATGPAKRFILDNVMSLLSSADLAKYVNLIVDQAGSDATEQQCETACLDVLANDLLDTACPFICNSFQALVHRFHLNGQPATGPAKRFILDNVMSLLSISDLAKYVNLIVDQAGSDATEQQCETACLDVMANDLLDTACPFICNSFQALVHRFHLNGQPATGPAKRFILDNVMSLLSSADLAKYVNLIVDQAGSDATEQQCETACLDVMANDLLDTACPFICNSFQALVHRFHLNGQPATGPAKRFILDNVMSLLSSADLAKYVNLIVDQAGSDATEQQCETACLDVMANDLLDTTCPFICNSFQTLLHRFHLNGQPATGPAKRFVLDNMISLLRNAVLAKYLNLIVDQLGSDATDQQCETACLDVMANHRVENTCPFLCYSFQAHVHQFHLNGQPATGPAKRFILDNVMSLLSSADLAKYVNLIVDQAGSDATEQQCETACLDVMANDLLDTTCPFICNSFQTLLHRFHLNGQPATGPAKRFVLDNMISLLRNAVLAKYLNLIVDQVGSDATDQQCETACLDVMANHRVENTCPFLCYSFQAHVHQFHLNGQPATGPAKRFILDNVMSFLSSADLAKYVNLIVDQAGSDATEQQCETACLDVMANDLLDTACPFICNSFQALVHRFHLNGQPATGPAKRFILDNVMSLLSTSDLAKYVNLIVDQAGSDATEQQCETACLDVMANDLLDTACPFICNSFQALVHRFHLNGRPATGPAKRFILDNVMSFLSSADLAKYVNLIVDQAGSDATEQQCETACLDVMANDLLDTTCPFICNSFQTLLHRFHLNGQPATGPAKRFILDNVMNLLSSTDLAKYVNLIVDQAGSDATEQQCETACLDVMANDLLDTACPFICNSLQALVHRFHLNGQPATGPAKRFILDNVMSLLSTSDLAKYVNLIVDQAGSDATEQQCETACLDVMANDLLDTACPFICNSFQALVHRFHLNGQPATGPAKRFILDNVMNLLSSADLAKYVNLIVDQAGSDATEQQCETACLDVMANDLLDTACPFICNSFQALVHRFHLNGQPATGPAKRFILDNVMSLLSTSDLAKYVNLIVDQAGSDATEQQCETACLDVMANDLLDTACPFICNSFQALVHRFHLNGQPATGPAKRFILDNVMSFLSSADLAKYVNLIVDQAGSDATEQQCETACLDVMANDLLDTTCPFICNSFQTLVHRFHLNGQPASGPAKRFILDNVMNLLSSADLAKYVNLIVDQAGSDATEQQCETACLDVMANDLLDTACPFICNSFQALVHRFHLNGQPATGPAKRFILDNVMSVLSTSDLAKYVNLIVDQAGSDATEQQCETACLDVMANDLLDTACPFICNSFQALVHRFHLNGQPATGPAKRFILDNVMSVLSTSDLAKYVNLIVDQAGSDATEQQCETACLDVMANDLLDTACPFICNSFQALVHRFHLNGQPATGPAKRFILDNVMSFLSSADLAKYVNLIVDQAGSDATEQQCETACLNVMANERLDTTCPFICNSFQTLVHRFHLNGQPATGPAKRFILDNVMSFLSTSDLAKYLNLIVDQAGSDATEQQCETACLDVMANDLLDTACPFICNSFQAHVHRFHLNGQPATGPAKRFILDNVMSFLSSADLAKYVNLIVDQAGSDATEQQCETACLDVMANDLLDTACPFICNSFQALVHRFHLNGQPATGPAKRFILDNVMSLLSTSDLAKYVNLIVDQAGSDATEQQCETACLDVMANDLLDTACPFICNSFQALVHRFHLNGQPATGPAKRFILDNVMSFLSSADLAKYVNLIVDQAGSDATEQQCETACLDVMANDLLDTTCPFICNSFQTLVHRFHLNGQPATGPAKRFILDNMMSLLSSAVLAKYVNLIVDQAGSDATDQQCETTCLDVMANDLLDNACPFICNSFQTFVQKFHLGA